MIYDETWMISRTLLYPNGCWEWQGAIGSHGYGALSRGRLAHRVAFEIFYKLSPKGKVVMHECDNRSCCNPEHLVLGSHSDNTADAIEKGRLKPNPRITDEQIAEIRRLFYEEEMKQPEIAKRFSIAQSYVSRIVNFVRR